MNLKEKIEQFLDVASVFLTSDNLKTTNDIVSNYKERLKKPMQIAIVGKIKASKSTLVNAILGTDNVVQTGGMELTFNVSWLKYSDEKKDAIVHFKNGETKAVSKQEWEIWANAYAKDEIKNNISYMEIFLDNPILKEINIIDTPGLLSGGIDAQNTIDFLSKKEHKPDAVVVLFADALHEAVASVISEFQNRSANDVEFTPINTLGVYSKIDKIWEPDNAKITFEYPYQKASEICNRVLNDPNTKSLFYNIYPLNSLLSIASFSFNDKDIELIKTFSDFSIKKTEESLIDVSDFLSEIDLPFSPCTSYCNKGYCSKSGKDEPCKVDFHLPIDFENDTDCIRRYLFGKFDRFGIMLLCTYINDNPEASLNDIKQYLRRYSGFNQFFQILKNHFGERATLIKMQSAVSNLLAKLSSEKEGLIAETKHESAELVDKIYEKLNDIIKEDPEFQLFEILVALYDGKLSDMSSNLYTCNFTQEELENDIKCLVGENGVSFPARLGLNEELSIDRLQEEIKLKIEKWRCVAREFSENATEPYYQEYAIVMYKAYHKLSDEIGRSYEKFDELQNLIKISNK